MICDKCKAGQMVEYQRTLKFNNREAVIMGTRCDRCGYVRLDRDEDIWSVVGL
jgi:uncharacterized OB-fold protein